MSDILTNQENIDNEEDKFDKEIAVLYTLAKFSGKLVYNDVIKNTPWMLQIEGKDQCLKFSDTEIRCAIVEVFDRVKLYQYAEGGVADDEAVAAYLTKTEVDDIFERLRSEAWFDRNGLAHKMVEYLFE